MCRLLLVLPFLYRLLVAMAKHSLTTLTWYVEQPRPRCLSCIHTFHFAHCAVQTSKCWCYRGQKRRQPPEDDYALAIIRYSHVFDDDDDDDDEMMMMIIIVNHRRVVQPQYYHLPTLSGSPRPSTGPGQILRGPSPNVRSTSDEADR